MSRAQLTSTVEQNSAGAAAPVVAGKNLLANGAQDYWQRGTSFSGSFTYSSDRWYSDAYNVSGTTSQSTTVPTGYRYSLKMQRPASNSTANAASIGQILETQATLPLQGQNVTFSFWAKAGANISNVGFVRVFTGTGTDQSISSAYGSWTGYTEIVSAGFTPTTTWTKFTFTGVVGSSATQIGVRVGWITAGTAGADDSLYLTGLQLEQGSVATPFSRAGGTLQGELALCQRYYIRWSQPNGSSLLGSRGVATSSTNAQLHFMLPVAMRINPTVLDYANLQVEDGTTPTSITGITSITGTTLDAVFNATVASGLTQYRSYGLQSNSSGNAYISCSAEL